MTICIGVICDRGEKVVVGSDRMLTGWLPPVEYEPDETKIVPIGDSCVVLTAGNAIAHTELLKVAIPEVQKKRSPSLPEIVDILSECYDGLRKKKVIEEILRPRGLNLRSFYEKIRLFPSQFYLPIDRRIATYDYDLQMLIAGVDDSGGHLYDVRNPGITNCFDTIGHHEIGSGIIQAKTIFTNHKYSKKTDLTEAIYLVYEAKRSAEVAPGVGEEIDMVAVSAGCTNPISGEVVGKLNGVYREKLEGKKGYKEIITELNTFFEEGGGMIENEEGDL